MKKMLVAFSMMLAFSLSASAADSFYNFTLRDNNGNAFCNIAFLRLYSPAAGIPKAVVAGYYFSPECDGNIYPGGGFKHALSPTLQTGHTGTVLDLGTPAYFNYTGTNTQLLVNTAKHTWTLYQSSDFNTNNLINAGTWVNGTQTETKGGKDAAQR
jgi:hypothetical protein